MDYRWEITSLSEEQIAIQQLLVKDLHISMASAHLLVCRGVRNADEARMFVRPSLDCLHDPFLMQDMQAAVERLTQAIQNNERILIYGDYDVDGTTAVALIYRFLATQTQHLDFYIPDRYTEGYGISFKGIDYAKEQGCTLIIALDCGIKAIDKVAYAQTKGIDFIICDHHTPGDTLPQAVAVLNMKRADCHYPYKDLSGCGVGFKFMQAYAIAHHIPLTQVYRLLPLLAMSIASDIVPITGENRILAYFGLRQMNSDPFVGIKCLMQIANIEPNKLSISDLVYKIGPRINASGRMKSGAEAVQLLITDDIDVAQAKAGEIDSYNAERKDYDSKTTDEALELLKLDPDNDNKYSTVVYAPHWHKGVIGIAASRLIEHHYRPTIVLTNSEDGIISGSARSAGGFDIYSAIDSCRDLLTNFGGHIYAAGLSMHIDNLPAFKERFEAYVAEHIQPEQCYPTIRVEQEICFADINKQFFSILQHLEPFGPGNPRPIFVTRNVINHRYTKRVGKMGEHLRLDVTDQTAAITGISFGKGELALHIQNGHPIDVCYEINENTYNNVSTIQMMVQDIKKKE